MILYLYLLLFLKPWKIFFDSINDKRNKNNENNENILVESNSFNENETDSIINNTPSLSESIKVRYSLEKDINNSSKRSISEINQSIQEEEEENSNKKLKIDTEESSELSTINQPKSPETPKTPELSYFKSDI